MKFVNKENVFDYVSDIASIHKSAYSEEHFSSLLDIQHLTDYYKELIFNSDISIVCTEKGNTLGFIISGVNISQGVSIYISVNRIYLLKLMLLNPKFILRKIISKFESLYKGTFETSCPFRLMSISVSKDHQSAGIGVKMLDFLESKLILENISRYGLSVKSENKRAIGFYKRNGFVLEGCSGNSVYLKKTL